MASRHEPVVHSAGSSPRAPAERIARAHGVLIERGPLIGPDTPAEHLHVLRKDAKKL